MLFQIVAGGLICNFITSICRMAFSHVIKRAQKKGGVYNVKY